MKSLHESNLTKMFDHKVRNTKCSGKKTKDFLASCYIKIIINDHTQDVNKITA